MKTSIVSNSVNFAMMYLVFGRSCCLFFNNMSGFNNSGLTPGLKNMNNNILGHRVLIQSRVLTFSFVQHLVRADNSLQFVGSCDFLTKGAVPISSVVIKCSFDPVS